VKNVNKKVETEKTDLIALAEKAFPNSFKCEPDAKEAIKHFQKTKKTALFKFSFDILAIEEEKKYRGPKPRNGRNPEFVTVYKVVIKELVPDNDRIEALKRKEESFVLITNVPTDELTDREVLRKYKNQGVVERSFSRLKRPMMVDTLFLKTPKRVEALMSIVYIALLFQSIMQAMARYRANKVKILPKIKYAKRELNNPTYELLVYLLQPFVVITNGHSIEKSCNVPELERHLDLILLLLDAEEC
jgi:transposase